MSFIAIRRSKHDGQLVPRVLVARDDWSRRVCSAASGCTHSPKWHCSSGCIRRCRRRRRRVVSNMLLHLACMPRIVCIAPRNPRKQRVRPPRRNEKKERERRASHRCLAHVSFIYHRPRFFVLHVSLKLESATKRFALFSVVSFDFIWYSNSSVQEKT